MPVRRLLTLSLLAGCAPEPTPTVAVVPPERAFSAANSGGEAWLAEADLDRFGLLVRAIGDVNGDGLGDFAVGSALGGPLDFARIYVFFGVPGGLPATWSVVLDAEQYGDGFAHAFAGAGDVDGDGYDDLVASAYAYDASPEEGRVYVFRGGPAGPAGPGVVLGYHTGGGQYGAAVAGVGDVDGDGFADVAIGAPQEIVGNTNLGKVYVHRGGPTGLDPVAAWSWTGVTPGGGFGARLGSAGDVDGDGYPDVLVTAAGESVGGHYSAGVTRVYRGGAGGLPATASWKLSGAKAYDFGAAAGVGDVDGDGYDDVAIGSPGTALPGFPPDPAEVLVYRGGPAGPVGAPWAVWGNGAQLSGFAEEVFPVGDFTGDGYDDVGVRGRGGYGTPWADNWQVQIFAGGPVPATEPAHVFSGTLGLYGFTADLAALGDVDGDGYGDVLFGEQGAGAGGLAYVEHGRPHTPLAMEVDPPVVGRLVRMHVTGATPGEQVVAGVSLDTDRQGGVLVCLPTGACSGLGAHVNLRSAVADALGEADVAVPLPLDALGWIRVQAAALGPDVTELGPVAELRVEIPTADADGDGLYDVLEARSGTDPAAPDSDGDGLLDGEEILGIDRDGDGVGDLAEAVLGTDPRERWSYCTTRWSPVTIGNPGNGMTDVVLADVDGDGDLDVVYGGDPAGTVRWYRNKGAGGFGAAILVADLFAVDDVAAADLDGDGDLDLVAAASADDLVAWYENLGGGAFGAMNVLSATADLARAVVAADLDGDGDVDVASAAEGRDELAWYENTGAGFAAGRTIGTGDGARALAAGDLDGDGLVDLVLGSKVDDTVRLFENLGGGSFAAPWVLATDLDQVATLALGDVGADGDLDLLAGSAGDGAVTWFEAKRFGYAAGVDLAFVRRDPQTVGFADLDGDGLPEGLASDGLGLAFFGGLGDGTLGTSAWSGHSVSLDGGAFDTGDLDGDGNVDVVYATSGSLIYELNPGDADGDGLYARVEECDAGTDPDVADSDGGGVADGDELAALTDPRDPTDD